MFSEISLEDAARTRWDFIIAGSSFAGLFFMRELPAELKVLVVERGPMAPHSEQLTTRQSKWRDSIEVDNSSGLEKTWLANSLFGGSSNFWWAQTPRFHPSDFELKRRYGVGQDWPYGYAELEPFYTEAEALMEIAGGADRTEFLPMSAPYPLAPHVGTLIDRQLWGTRGWVSIATARSTGGSRALCCANGVCHLCPVDSKFTVLNGFEHFARPNVRLLQNTEVRRVIDINKPHATGVELQQSGVTQALLADNVALAANGISNPAILLRSELKNPIVGRYIHEQVSKTVTIDLPEPNYFGGTSATSHNYHFYDGQHRSKAGAVLIENFNKPNRLRLEPGKWTHRAKLRVIAEDLPLAENRVVLDESDAAKVIWRGHADYALKGLDRAIEGLQEIYPWPIGQVIDEGVNPTEAHIQGTCRIGNDPDEGVVNGDLKVFGSDNVWVLGASAFPTCSPANPTLTLSALSMRAGRRII